MKKLVGRLALVGVVVGGIVAARAYLSKSAPARDVAQLVFDDGSTHAFASNTAEAEELADLARKLIETGV